MPSLRPGREKETLIHNGESERAIPKVPRRPYQRGRRGGASRMCVPRQLPENESLKTVRLLGRFMIRRWFALPVAIATLILPWTRTASGGR